MESKFCEIYKYYIKKVYSYIWDPKRALNTKIAKNTSKCVDLAEIYDTILGLSKFFDWIFILGNSFELFLVVKCNNLIENISNNKTFMIFSSINSWAGRGLNQYITKSFKNS